MTDMMNGWRTASCAAVGFVFLLTGATGAQALDIPADNGANGDNNVAIATATNGFILPLLNWSETERASMVFVANAQEVGSLHDVLGYDIASVRAQQAEVPRLFLSSLPVGWTDIGPISERKGLFIRTVLPMVLRVNEAIAADRAMIISLRDRLVAGNIPSTGEMQWLVELAQLYAVIEPAEDGTAVMVTLEDLDALLTRVDIVPTPMALAQAIAESGWGRSRFAREGNAMFGQYTWGAAGIVPANRSAGATHSIRRFDSLLESVVAYTMNLNTHPAYREFRADRARMRAAGQPLDAYALIGTLTRYAENPHHYISYIRNIMTSNELEDFTTARLAEGESVRVQPTRF